MNCQTKYDKSLLKSVTGITKWDRRLLQTERDNSCKVRCNTSKFLLIVHIIINSNSYWKDKKHSHKGLLLYSKLKYLSGICFKSSASFPFN